jgi:hypothetical protein
MRLIEQTRLEAQTRPLHLKGPDLTPSSRHPRARGSSGLGRPSSILRVERRPAEFSRADRAGVSAWVAGWGPTALPARPRSHQGALVEAMQH